MAGVDCDRRCCRDESDRMRHSLADRVYHHEGVCVCDAPDHVKVTFGEVLAKDYGTRSFDFDRRAYAMRCVDLDAWECAGGGVNDKTMDCAVGIRSYNPTSRSFSSERFMLVEFKLACTSVSTVTPGEIVDKVSHSKELLGAGCVERVKVVVFPEKLRAAYQSKFKRRQGSSAKRDYEDLYVTDPSLMSNFIGYAEDFPYKPINDEAVIISCFNDSDGCFDADKLDRGLRHWSDLASNYRRQYNMDEYDHIMRTLNGLLLMSMEKVDSEEEKEYFEMEFPNILGYSNAK